MTQQTFDPYGSTMTQPIETLLAEADRYKWQPIADAPKDGTRIIVYRPSSVGKLTPPAPSVGEDYYGVSNSLGDKTWMRSNKHCMPTHWVPMSDFSSDIVAKLASALRVAVEFIEKEVGFSFSQPDALNIPQENYLASQICKVERKSREALARIRDTLSLSAELNEIAEGNSMTTEPTVKELAQRIIDDVNTSVLLGHPVHPLVHHGYYVAQDYLNLVANLTPEGLCWLEENPDSVNRCGAGEAGVYIEKQSWDRIGGEDYCYTKYERIDTPVTEEKA